MKKPPAKSKPKTPARQKAKGCRRPSPLFAFVVVRTRYIGIGETFRTRIGPMKAKSAWRLAQYLRDGEDLDEGTNYAPVVVARTSAEPASGGWSTSVGPRWVRSLLESENARIQKANAGAEAQPPDR